MTNVASIQTNQDHQSAGAIASMDAYFVNWAYITKKKMFINIKTGEMISKEGFSDLLGHIDFPIKNARDGNGQPYTKIAKTAADSFNKNQFKEYTKVYGTSIDSEHKCGQIIISSDGVKTVNTWNGTAIRPVKHDNNAVELFYDLANKIFPPKDLINIINWMAHVVQFPTRKVLWSPIIVGTKGNGKTTLAIVLSKIIGDRYSKTIDKETLKDSFNGWIEMRCLAVIEEIKVGGDFAIIDKLKQYVSNETISVRGMHADSADKKNHCDLIICSNHVDALKIENDERRWYPVLTNQRPGDEVAVVNTFGENKGAEYFNKFYNDVVRSKQGLEAVCYHLMNIDLTNFNMGTAPDSTHKQEFIAMTMTNGAMSIDEIIKDYSLDVKGIVLKKSVDEAGRNAGAKIPNTKAFGLAMRELGYDAYPGRVNIFRGAIKSSVYVHSSKAVEYKDIKDAWVMFKSGRSSLNTYHYSTHELP